MMNQRPSTRLAHRHTFALATITTQSVFPHVVGAVIRCQTGLDLVLRSLLLAEC